MIRFGEIIRNRRSALQLSLEELGRRAGTTKGYMSGVENSKSRPPTPKKVTRLCKVLGLNEESMQLLAYVEKAPEKIRTVDVFSKFADVVDTLADLALRQRSFTDRTPLS